MSQQLKLAVRPRPGNSNHHLWNNHGTWWCHFTVHLPDFTKERVRMSLNTADVAVARALRDAMLALYSPAMPEREEVQ